MKSQNPVFQLPIFFFSIDFPPSYSFALRAAVIDAKTGANRGKDLPVQASVSPVEVVVLVADRVAWKPVGGSKARHHCFKPGWVREEGFVRGAEGDAGHGREVREKVSVAGPWPRRHL